MADTPKFKADEPADEGERWTVRGVSRDARNTAKSAADEGRQSVGEWLTAVIISAASGQTVPADTARTTGSGSADPVADIERLVSAASALAAAGNVPPGVRAPLNRAIKDQARRLAPPAVTSSGRQSGGLVTAADKAAPGLRAVS